MKKIIFALFVAFMTSSVLAEEATEQATAPVPVNQTISISDDMKLTDKTEHEENKQQLYTIDVTYPQIEGENLSATAEQFNKLIQEEINKNVSQFKRYVLADMPHMKSLPEEVRKNTFNIGYEVDAIKPKKDILLSVRLIIEGFQAGRAHPYHLNQVIHFNLSNGKILALNAFFKPKANYLKIIANYSRIKLNEKIDDKLMIAEGTKPLAKNFKNWTLKNDGIVFIFDEYQVAPYSYGAQEVEIPYEVLKNVISPKAVIYPCVVNPGSCLFGKM